MGWAGYDGDDSDKTARFKFYLIIAYWGHNIMFWGGNLAHLVIYKLKSPFLESYKINPEKSWPWEENYEDWIKKLRKATIYVILSNVFYAFILICFDNYVMDGIKMRMDLESFPGHNEIIK